MDEDKIMYYKCVYIEGYESEYNWTKFELAMNNYCLSYKVYKGNSENSESCDVKKELDIVRDRGINWFNPWDGFYYKRMSKEEWEWEQIK